VKEEEIANYVCENRRSGYLFAVVADSFFAF
jgi:hypothetical protein